MATKTECYADTSAFIAFLDRSDSFHPRFRLLFAKPPRLVTSALVVAEGHGWFLRRYDARRASEFLAFLRELPHLTITPFDEQALTQATRIVHKFQDQNLTLADAHGLALIANRKIAYCWSTDRHLALTGARLTHD